MPPVADRTTSYLQSKAVVCEQLRKSWLIHFKGYAQNYTARLSAYMHAHTTSYLQPKAVVCNQLCIDWLISPKRHAQDGLSGCEALIVTVLAAMA